MSCHRVNGELVHFNPANGACRVEIICPADGRLNPDCPGHCQVAYVHEGPGNQPPANPTVSIEYVPGEGCVVRD